MSQLFSGKLDKRSSFVAVVMAGGSGTRFWPLSRSANPKQLLPLARDSKTLLEATLERLTFLPQTGSTLIVTAEHQAERVRAVAPQAAVLAEPIPRNTAPCLGYAAKLVLATVGDVPLVCLPADHLIADERRLADLWQRAMALVREEELLITIGIEPTAPETGYGYIRSGAAYRDGSFRVEAFVEKPDRATAEEYVQSGRYFWNSGMFVWRASTLRSAIARYLPALWAELDGIRFGCADEEASARAAFEKIEPISIDYGVMEKAPNVVVYPGRLGWSDVGSWSSWLETVAPGGENVLRGDALAVNCRASALLSSKKLLAGVGLENIIVVETEDAILVCDARCAQDVKQVVDLLRERNRGDLL